MKTLVVLALLASLVGCKTAADSCAEYAEFRHKESFWSSSQGCQLRDPE